MSEVRKIDGGIEGPIEVRAGGESEPLRGRALYTSIAGAIVGAAASFGLPLTDAQQGAVAILLALAAPQVVAWWSRRHVNSPATMQKILSRR